MSKLIVMVGPPGSGKSTFAKTRLVANEGFTYINQDSQGKDHLKLFEEAVAKGVDIVVDRMGFSKAQRARYLEPAKKAGYKTEIVILHQPWSTCWERVNARKDHETIKDEQAARSALNTFFNKYERPQEGEADEISPIYPSGDKPSVVVCDLDGTLCKIDHRLHFVRTSGQKKNWVGFFENMDKDEVNTWCADILKGLAKDHKIVYCSGRPDNWGNATAKWLADKGMLNFPEKPHLFMRPRGDSRDDSIVKEIILDFEILTRFKPYFMIDDRKRVVDMWRKRGFTVLHCADGDF